MIMEIDELTIAYLAMGAKTALDKRNGLGDRVDEFEGELGFISSVISFAPMLDAEFERARERFCGVFAYEIAEPFGERCAEEYLDGFRARFDSNAQHLARAMIEDASEPEKRENQKRFVVDQWVSYRVTVEADDESHAMQLALELPFSEWDDSECRDTFCQEQ